VGAETVIANVKDRSWLIGVAAIDVSIARDFGALGGVLFGKITSLDDSGPSCLYHVRYTDGREENLERSELLRGYELFGAMALGTYKPLVNYESEASIDDKFVCEDAWSSDSEQQTKRKRRPKTKVIVKPKQRKRKTCATEPHGGKQSATTKKAKVTTSKDDKSKVKRVTVKSSFSLGDVLAAWTDTTDFGASFRSLDEAEQKKELAQINVGAAKGIKGAVKSKVLNAQYKDMMAIKMKEYIQSNMVGANAMFRATVVSDRAAQILRSGFLSVGEWVEVDADRTPGYNSEGGIAIIINVHDSFADVKYVNFQASPYFLPDLMLTATCPLPP
jgi:hypothetical protein